MSGATEWVAGSGYVDAEKRVEASTTDLFQNQSTRVKTVTLIASAALALSAAAIAGLVFFAPLTVATGALIAVVGTVAVISTVVLGMAVKRMASMKEPIAKNPALTDAARPPNDLQQARPPTPVSALQGEVKVKKSIQDNLQQAMSQINQVKINIEQFIEKNEVAMQQFSSKDSSNKRYNMKVSLEETVGALKGIETVISGILADITPNKVKVAELQKYCDMAYGEFTYERKLILEKSKIFNLLNLKEYDFQLFKELEDKCEPLLNTIKIRFDNIANANA